MSKQPSGSESSFEEIEDVDHSGVHQSIADLAFIEEEDGESYDPDYVESEGNGTDNEDYIDDSILEEFSSEEEDDENESDDYLESGDEANYTASSYKWAPYTLILIVILIVGLTMGHVPTTSPDLSSPSTKATFMNLQMQVNNLYQELSQRDEKSKSDFDRSVEIVVSKFEDNLKNLLPVDVVNLKSQLVALNDQVNSLSDAVTSWQDRNNKKYHQFTLRNMTDLQEKLLSNLETNLPNEVPIVMNGTSSFLIIPELHTYLSNLISNILNISSMNNTESHGGNINWEYNVNEYVKEILTNELKYVDKDFFIKELNRRLQENKERIWQEINIKLEDEKDKIRELTYTNDQSTFPQQYSSILLKKMIYQIYNTNQHQWEGDLDFASSFQGTRLMNHLTSPTWNHGNGVGPIELLTSSRLTGSTYWQCQDIKECSWAIRFNKPIYLTKVSYIHGRFTNNLHMMNSAPKLISLYVRLAGNSPSVEEERLTKLARKYGQGQPFGRDKRYIKIAQFQYSIESSMVRQSLALPRWYIESKPLIHSLVLQVDSNYGNENFTSLKKFIINGLTREDLDIMQSDKFLQRFQEVPEYGAMPSSAVTSFVIQEHPPIQGNHNRKPDEEVPSFGDDELDT
ncbi:hypothetical protein NCAS_0A07060 [Naumovozyma castellii]|uniref:SUN domain-containing protein n=1 Tax=Naumovozyma castellii TaxID=27288 RepID=G0V716_NAUCA|nr:hypothetical protein NCAS_0A07060 [Naumovozyma castellii CBS 4309]CCC67264.1 hypothetical protein NCAS_0A07060 [Naumovozyma castellii CBS 4309]